MLDTPQIVQVDARNVAVIHVTVPRPDIGKVMGPSIGEVMGAVGSQGIAPTGPVFSHHLRLDRAVFDFEVGVPVAAAVKAVGRVKPGTLPGGTVARTVYRGPYEGLGPAWEEFDRWIVAQGYTPAPNLWECYLRGPESGPDDSEWQTELVRPVSR